MCLEQKGADVQLRVFIQPKSSRNEIIGIHNNALKIKITAPPVEDEANSCVIEFLSEVFRIPKRDIQIVKGQTSRNKVVHIRNQTVAAAGTVLKV